MREKVKRNKNIADWPESWLRPHSTPYHSLTVRGQMDLAQRPSLSITQPRIHRLKNKLKNQSQERQRVVTDESRPVGLFILSAYQVGGGRGLIRAGASSPDQTSSSGPGQAQAHPGSSVTPR